MLSMSSSRWLTRKVTSLMAWVADDRPPAGANQEIDLNQEPWTIISVSYTHLDVYKRQILNRSLSWQTKNQVPKKLFSKKFQNLKEIYSLNIMFIKIIPILV